MKRTVRVTIEKEYEIELKPDVLTQQFVDDFESYMFELDGDTLEEKQEYLIRFAAGQIAEHGAEFIEGIGQTSSIFTYQSRLKEGQKVNVLYENTGHWIDTEVVT